MANKLRIISGLFLIDDLKPLVLPYSSSGATITLIEPVTSG
jgi:hypothetical protein